MKTEIINAPETRVDTTTYKPRKELIPQQEDTTRQQIGFNPSVEDWDEHEDINI